MQDADNYYVARANALEDNVRFYRVVAGRREQLGGANLKVTPNEWHTLGLRAEGERFTVSYDGKTLFSVTDRTFAEAGGVALWTKSDSVTRFDRMTITVVAITVNAGMADIATEPRLRPERADLAALCRARLARIRRRFRRHHPAGLHDRARLRRRRGRHRRDGVAAGDGAADADRSAGSRRAMTCARC